MTTALPAYAPIQPDDDKARDNAEWFGRNVRAAARILWKDPTDLVGFVDTLTLAVQRGYEAAWAEGAAACGILPADRTPEESAVLGEYVSIALQRVFPLAEFVAVGSQPNGGKWSDLQPRLNIWINRYAEVKARAQVMSCKDQKLKWVIDPQKESCSTCIKLNGRIYRASIWSKYDIYPRDTRPGKLNCHGFKCGCAFQATTEPVTPGRPPNVP
jgi:hypothetical protein